MVDDNLIAEFCSITASSSEEAIAFLEMSNMDLDRAISLYFDTDGNISNQFNNDNEDVNNEEDEMNEDEMQRSNTERIYISQDIYRPDNVDDQSHGINVFGDNNLDSVAKNYELPDCLKGPYLLEVARENAVYGPEKKWVFLSLFDKTDFIGGCINRDIFHNSSIIDIMQANFVLVQHCVSENRFEATEGNRLRNYYNVNHLPYHAIINPLTGAVETLLSPNHYSNADQFMEFIINFLTTHDVSILPNIPSPSVEIKTSLRKTPITPANVKSKTIQSCKRHRGYKDSKPSKPSKPSNSSIIRDTNQNSPISSPTSETTPYRDISIEPGVNACRLRLRKPSGITVLCVYKLATLNELMAYIQHTYEEFQGHSIDILSGTPPVSLSNQGNKTLEELKLNGSAIIAHII